MNNDTPTLTGYQVPENAPYQAYDKPVEPTFLSNAFQKAKEGYEEALRKRLEEEAKEPLADEPKEEQLTEAQQAWNNLMQHPIVQAFRAAKEQAEIHKHGPFTFLLNQNHNALRGCQSCGATWVGSMAGNEDNLRWHPVYEIEEEE